MGALTGDAGTATNDAQRLESSVAEALARWSLERPTLLAETATSRVLRVERADGPAVLKVLKPYGASDELRGARLMQWYDGDGAAEIFDIAGGAILMEWLDGGPLGDVVRAGGDDEATSVICHVVGRLHGTRGTAAGKLAGFEPWFRALLTAKPFWPASHDPLFARAIAMFGELMATAPAPIPIHGDVHHENIVGSRRGWLAIDPKGLAGDPAYDVANVFRNPDGAGDLPMRTERIEGLADRFSAHFGWERRRVLAWAAVHSAISACWDHEANNPFDGDLRMLPLLFEAVDRPA